MVYCKKCGAQNTDDASICASCGEPLKASYRVSRRRDDECFGLPGGGSIVGLLFGIAIILLGASELMNWNIDLGPYAIIAFGLLIVAGALYQQNQRRR